MKSNTEWKFWGERDPLYGVASWEGREKDGTNPWTDEEFYRLGEQDWADFQARWEKYGVTPGRCVEIGCGAGRLTRPMAGFFQHVAGIDVSEAMIDYARDRIDNPGIEYHVVEGGAIPGDNGTFDAVFSAHVFQHLDSPRDAALYFREIARVLKPGGSMMIHLPICAWPPGSGSVVKWLYRARKSIGSVLAAVKRLAIRHGRSVALMRLQSFEIDWLYDRLTELGLEEIEISVCATGSNGAPHPFVLARKPMP